MGRKIGEIIDLSGIGQNYKVKLTGGSDKAGFPMRRDVMGSGKRYVLMTRGGRVQAPGRGREEEEAGEGRDSDRGGLPAERVQDRTNGEGGGHHRGQGRVTLQSPCNLRPPERPAYIHSASLSIPEIQNFPISSHGSDNVYGPDDAYPKAARV